MSRPLRLLLLSGWAMASVTAGAASHCQGEEREVFSCALRNGKTVSICASPALSADAGYLQYRYGRLGHVELEYPSSRTGSQARFDFESHRPYQGEYESLGFEKDGYRYSTYRVLTSEPGQKNRTASSRRPICCAAPLTFRRGWACRTSSGNRDEPCRAALALAISRGRLQLHGQRLQAVA
jgi:hypothetical protein